MHELQPVRLERRVPLASAVCGTIETSIGSLICDFAPDDTRLACLSPRKVRGIGEFRIDDGRHPVVVGPDDVCVRGEQRQTSWPSRLAHGAGGASSAPTPADLARRVTSATNQQRDRDDRYRYREPRTKPRPRKALPCPTVPHPSRATTRASREA